MARIGRFCAFWLREAAAFFRACFGNKATSALANRARGDAYVSTMEYDKALSEFNKAIRLNPKDADSYLGRGNAYLAKDEYDRAIADYTTATRLDPGYATPYNNRGSAYRRMEDYDRAIKDYTEAVQLDPTYSSPLFNRGCIFSFRKDYARAISDFTEAIRLYPHDTVGHVDLDKQAIRYASQQRDTKPIGDCTNSVPFDPRLAEAYARRGLAYKKVKQYESARGDYETAIRIDPGNDRALNLLAWLLATCPSDSLRDGKKAVEHATEACKLSNWKDANKLDTLAAGCAECGDFQEAVKWQKQAIELGQLNPEQLEEARHRLRLHETGTSYREE